MTSHAKFSPSGADRWMRCTASFYEHKPQPSSGYALEGQSAHDLAAAILNGKTLLEEWEKQTYEHLKLNPENIRALEYYLGELKLLRFTHTDPTELIEHRIKWSRNLWGTADHILWSLSILDVSDLKFGKGVIVDMDHNYQILTYLSLTLKNIYEDQGLNMPELIRGRIIQPRSYTGDLTSVKEFSPEDIKSFRQAQTDRIKDIKTGNISYNPSEKACQWCSAAKSGCKAYNEWMINKAGANFAEYIENPAEEFPPVNLVPKLSDEQVFNIFNVKSALKQYMEAIEKSAIQRQLKGADFKGMKLIQSNTHLKYTNEEKVLKKLKKAGLDLEKFRTLKLITPTQLRNKLKHDDSELLEKLEELIYQPPGDARLVPETAKGRPYETD